MGLRRKINMKIKLIGFYDGLYSIGLRRLSSYVKSFYDDVELYLYNVNGYGTYLKEYFFAVEDKLYLNPDFLKRVADADVIGISSMSNYFNLASEFIKRVKKINPDCYIVWGGAHAIMSPETAIPLVDAVCIGEGEKQFVELLDNLHTPNRDKIHGFWFRTPSGHVENARRPLMPSEEMDVMPHPDFSEDIIYVDDRRLTNLTSDIYLSAQGPNYMTVWSQGCPFKCSYCGNTKFLENDKKYSKLRYPSPEYIVREVKLVVDKYDFIGFVEFIDDNFFLIKNEDLVEFAHLYKKQIGLPFHVPGIFPGVIRHEETLDLLIEAGLRRVRMGIQTGSQRMLDFYERNASRKKVIDTANLLISKYPKVGPPEFDIIMDNPVEDENDRNETLALLDSLKPPFIPLIYSLRSTPGTNLRKYAEAHPEIPFIPLECSWKVTVDAKYSMRLYLYGLGKPSKLSLSLVEYLGKFPRLLAIVLKLVILLGLGRRLFYDLKIGNLSTLASAFPSIPRTLYKLGLLRRIQSRKTGVLKTKITAVSKDGLRSRKLIENEESKIAQTVTVD